MGKLQNKDIWASDEDFAIVLRHTPIPTFDLILTRPDSAVLMLRRKIAPYKEKWALPGLRMRIGRSIDKTLEKIAREETGLSIDLGKKILLDQYKAAFTSVPRHDISTCYVVPTRGLGIVVLNTSHFYSFRWISSLADVPRGTGGMYGHYLSMYFANVEKIQATFK